MGFTSRLLVSAMLAAACAAVPAAAAEPPEGRPCHWTGVNWEPVTGPTTWTAEVDGGPVVAAGSPVTLRCGIHVEDGRHSAPAAATVTSDTGDGVAVVPPQLVTFEDEYGYAVLCSAVTVGATTWYWAGGEWTPDPGSWCPAAPDATAPPDLPPPLDPVEAYLWCMHWGWYCPIGEYLACDVAAGAPDVPGVVESDEYGDVYVLGEWLWDCPPYGEPEAAR